MGVTLSFFACIYATVLPCRPRLKDTYPAVLEATPADQRGQIKATPQVGHFMVVL